MLTSVEGIYNSGKIRLLVPLAGIAQARVVVTVLPDSLIRAADPLDLPPSADERAIWEELPRFRAKHPVRFQSLTDCDDGAPGDSAPT